MYLSTYAVEADYQQDYQQVVIVSAEEVIATAPIDRAGEMRPMSPGLVSQFAVIQRRGGSKADETGAGHILP